MQLQETYREISCALCLVSLDGDILKNCNVVTTRTLTFIHLMCLIHIPPVWFHLHMYGYVMFCAVPWIKDHNQDTGQFNHRASLCWPFITASTSLLSNDIEHLIMGLCAICISSLVNYQFVFSVFCPFFKLNCLIIYCWILRVVYIF